jgi:hypothetical protein
MTHLTEHWFNVYENTVIGERFRGNGLSLHGAEESERAVRGLRSVRILYRVHVIPKVIPLVPRIEEAA